jgi:hypothetical protein
MNVSAIARNAVAHLLLMTHKSVVTTNWRRLIRFKEFLFHICICIVNRNGGGRSFVKIGVGEFAFVFVSESVFEFGAVPVSLLLLAQALQLAGPFVSVLHLREEAVVFELSRAAYRY